MPLPDQELTKLYYTIGEVADMFAVSNSLIRFWESEFDILNPKKNSKGDRRFTKKDIHNLKLIYHLVKDKGYTLDGAKKELKGAKDHLEHKMKHIEDLKNIKQFLQKIKDGLTE